MDERREMTKEEAIKILSNRDGWGIPTGYSGGVAEAINMVIEALKAEPRWIPCSERLPDKSGRYLCSVGATYRNPREMYYAPQEWAKKSDDATWRSIDGSYVYDWFVVAWMPLPEPYKMDEVEENAKTD